MNLEHVEAALKAFSQFALAIEKLTGGKIIPRLILFSDGSGRIDNAKYGLIAVEEVHFSNFKELIEALQDNLDPLQR